MGSITILSLVEESAKKLEDEDYDRYTPTDLVTFCNMALETVCRIKPNAYSVRENVQLVSGSVQSLPSRRHALIRPVRNMGSTGSAPGAGIRLVDLDTLNDFDIDWHTTDDATAVSDIAYDPMHPLEFWVYPPATNYYVELITAAIPDAVDIDGVLPIPDIYRLPVIELITGYALQANRADASFSRGAGYIQSAMINLGVQQAMADSNVKEGSKK